MNSLIVSPLKAKDFASFGHVIEAPSRDPDIATSDNSYWDGAVQGAMDGKNLQPFQIMGGDKGQAAADSHSASYSEPEKQHYLNGYAAGYKAGYYAQHDSKTVASNHF